MTEIIDNSIKKTSINLSRNTPVALVVGAAGFLGSHLVDKLLDKGLQVIGIDDLKTNKRQNLQEAIKNKNFHLIIESPDQVELDLSRLDYLFIAPDRDWNLEKVLNLFKKTDCRSLFISSIDLYEKDNEKEELNRLKEREKEIARFAGIYKLNARVLRLGPVFGPRMDFKTKDPLVRLIQQALTGDLQKDVTLEFSSRALFVADAVDLIVKTMLAGSTAQKIFDGVNIEPIKVSEIKQVLMDPVWYETRDFIPSPLPPWSTPNLEKTIKFLNWHPEPKLIANLRQTLSYFKDNEIEVPAVQNSDLAVGEDKKELLEELKPGKQEEIPKAKQEIKLPKFSLPLSKIYLFALISLVTYALIWPAALLGWGILTFRSQLAAGLKNLEKGEFEKSLANIRQANDGLEAAKSVFQILEPIKKTGLFKTEFATGDQFISFASLSTSSAQSAALGTQALLQSLKAVTGELTESPAGYFDTAYIELSAAAEDLSKAAVFSKKLAPVASLVSKAQTMSILLPKLVALEGSKSYLILLQNNMELRPGGGFIGSFAKVSFAGGKLKKLDVSDIYAIDGKLNIHVEPPKEIKDDLGQKDWFLRDANWEPDFPTAARQAEWFYTKETGERVAGVIALDVSAMEGLLANIGPLNIVDYQENVTAENLFEKAISHAELSFFPGSQAKKSFLTALTYELFNKMFFLPQNNWPGIMAGLDRSLDEKHISIYLSDPKLFSYVLAQNWAHILPRQSTQNQDKDFLSVVEANLGANKANFYLDRSYDLETVVGKYGELKHRLRISYTNRSLSDTFPGGKYKNRMRIYLPFGSKLARALWGETDITKDVSSFVDFGRSGYSMLLQLLPREQKTLVLDYTVPVKLDFQERKATYKLNIIKQPGTLKDPFKWVISYPLGFQVVSDQTKTISPQQQTIQTDLSTDKSFEVQFAK